MEYVIKEVENTHEDQDCGHLLFKVYEGDHLHRSEVYHIQDFESDSLGSYDLLYVTIYNKIKSLGLQTTQEIKDNLVNTKYYE